jgi:outer membrane protein assembly factor BamB
MKGGAAVLALLVTAAMLSGGCGDDDDLVWSVRRGHVGHFAPRGDEVFTIGDELAVYHAASGQRLRRVALPRDFGNITNGQLAPELVVTPTALLVGWYDFAVEIGSVSCFDPSSLALRWEQRVAWPWDATLRPTFAVAADGEHAYAVAVGKPGHNVFKFRLADGQLTWARALAAIPTPDRLVLHDRALIVASRHTLADVEHVQLDAVETDGGTRRWRATLSGSTLLGVSPLVLGAHGYTALYRRPGGLSLYAVRLDDGVTTRTDIGEDMDGRPVAEHDGILYFGGLTPFAYDRRAARVRWTAAGDREMSAGAHGRFDAGRRLLHVGDPWHYVYAVDAETGQVVRRTRIDTYVRYELNPVKALFGSYGARRLELHQGLVFVGTADSSLFVFRPAR